MKATIQYHPLHLKRPAGTSRGELTIKHSWILEISDGVASGLGEVSVIPGLTPEFTSLEEYKTLLEEYIDRFNSDTLTLEDLKNQSALKFAVESALLDLNNGGNRMYFDNEFYHGTKSLPINGLIWMGSLPYIQEQIQEKLNAGFKTIKMKIGAIDVEEELKLLRNIRKQFGSDQITLRVDANGAFNSTTAPIILKALADIEIHSIEQPIPPGNWAEMRDLCQSTPTPIALDEELIGINETGAKIELLETIRPQFIILKPSLHGGISGTKEWIRLAEDRKIPWWMTSALESNIGLDVICQLTAEYQNALPQGLGTGSLYEKNFHSDLTVDSGYIFKKKGKQ